MDTSRGRPPSRRGRSRFPSLEKDRPVDLDQRASGADRHTEASLDPSRTRRILVVEDQAEVREGLAILLRLSGHEVDVTGDGPDALQRARSFRPDLVLLDLGLPGMDGYEVARRLREILGDSAQIVAVTG